MSKKFQDMLSDMPMEYMKISNDIIAYAKDSYDMKLNQSIYLALTDHINFAVQRYHKGVQLENALLGELKQAYDQEYKVGEYAIGLLKEQLGVKFSEHEAGFIALHFVNAKREF